MAQSQHQATVTNHGQEPRLKTFIIAARDHRQAGRLIEKRTERTDLHGIMIEPRVFKIGKIPAGTVMAIGNNIGNIQSVRSLLFTNILAIMVI